MRYGDWQRPGESLNDYYCRVDDEVRPHEKRDLRPLLAFILITPVLIILGAVSSCVS